MTGHELADLFSAAAAHQMYKLNAAGIFPGDMFGGWEFAYCNDLGIPYFRKPGAKTIYTIPAAAALLDDRASGL